MSPEELSQLVALGREFHGVEFKCAGQFTDKAFRATVVRGVLAMANRVGGGVVVLGVAELADKTLELEGLDEETRSSWADFDSVSDSINSYADPHVEFSLEEVVLDANTFLVLKVEEFEQAPVVCRKDYPGKLRAGACYVRGRNKPESVDVPTYAEMRELLDLAIQKGVRRWLSTTYAAGVDAAALGGTTDNEQFDAQDIPTTDVLEQIRSRGYWRIVVRPSKFVGNRVGTLGDLDRILRSNTVSLRGWDFPHLDHQNPIVRASDSLSQATAYGQNLGAWSMFKSGKFICERGLISDWQDRPYPGLTFNRDPIQPGEIFFVEEPAWHVLETMELASRLATSDVGAGSMVVELEIHGLRGRSLRASGPDRRLHFHDRRTCDQDQWVWRRQLSRSELVTNARALTVEASLGLMELLHWDPEPGHLTRVFEQIWPRA